MVDFLFGNKALRQKRRGTAQRIGCLKGKRARSTAAFTDAALYCWALIVRWVSDICLSSAANRALASFSVSR